MISEADIADTIPEATIADTLPKSNIDDVSGETNVGVTIPKAAIIDTVPEANMEEAKGTANTTAVEASFEPKIHEDAVTDTALLTAAETSSSETHSLVESSHAETAEEASGTMETSSMVEPHETIALGAAELADVDASDDDDMDMSQSLVTSAAADDIVSGHAVAGEIKEIEMQPSLTEGSYSKNTYGEADATSLGSNVLQQVRVEDEVALDLHMIKSTAGHADQQVDSSQCEAEAEHTADPQSASELPAPELMDCTSTTLGASTVNDEASFTETDPDSAKNLLDLTDDAINDDADDDDDMHVLPAGLMIINEPGSGTEMNDAEDPISESFENATTVSSEFHESTSVSPDFDVSHNLDEPTAACDEPNASNELDHLNDSEQIANIESKTNAADHVHDVTQASSCDSEAEQIVSESAVSTQSGGVSTAATADNVKEVSNNNRGHPANTT